MALGLADQVRLVCESLIESELGEVTLLLDGLLANYTATTLSLSTKACRTLPTKLLIVVPVARLRAMLLWLGGLGGLAYMISEKSVPVITSNSLT